MHYVYAPMHKHNVRMLALLAHGTPRYRCTTDVCATQQPCMVPRNDKNHVLGTVYLERGSSRLDGLVRLFRLALACLAVSGIQDTLTAATCIANT